MGARRRLGGIVVAVVMGVGLASCGGGEADGGRDARASDAASAPAAAPDVLMQADRDFDAAVAEGGVEAWVSWFAPDGRMVQPGVGLVQGHRDIRAQMVGLDDPNGSLRWQPDYADIAASGDLGWTTGTFRSEGVGPDGEPRTGQGRYVSIWRRQPDGSWKVVMDLGNPTGPPPAG